MWCRRLPLRGRHACTVADMRGAAAIKMLNENRLTGNNGEARLLCVEYRASGSECAVWLWLYMR